MWLNTVLWLVRTPWCGATSCSMAKSQTLSLVRNRVWPRETTAWVDPVCSACSPLLPQPSCQFLTSYCGRSGWSQGTSLLWPPEGGGKWYISLTQSKIGKHSPWMRLAVGCHKMEGNGWLAPSPSSKYACNYDFYRELVQLKSKYIAFLGFECLNSFIMCA